MDRKRLWAWVVLIFCCVCVKIFSFFPDAVERYYSLGFYLPVSYSLRLIFGWIPFSVGDILYGLFFIYVLTKMVFFFRRWVRKELARTYLRRLSGRLVFFLLGVYLAFNLLWGLNYNRQGIVSQLKIRVEKYDSHQLVKVLNLIVDRLDALDTMAHAGRPDLLKENLLFREAGQSYDILASKDPAFRYSKKSVKTSLFSWLGNWLGFTGYYNPFSGESQVNTTVPLFVQPFTTCHEIGHQLGYARENEANFAGYLSARTSPDPCFRYSVYFDLYLYAATELYLLDSTQLKPIRSRLTPGIRSDYRDLQKFYRSYKNPFEPYVRRLYGRYLKANEQPQGILSYNEVIAWLIAYSKKYGDQNI